jgi:DNA-binding MarR family transcriptional regulator
LATFEILIRLARSPGCRLPHHELSRQLSLSSGGITRIVDRLEKTGFVFRERDACDKRIYYVTLGEPGRAALEAALPVHASAVQRLLIDAVGPDGFAALEAAVRPLRDSLVGEPPTTSTTTGS